MTVVSLRGLEVSSVALVGFENSPAYAQRFMDHLLRPLDKFAKAYIDGVVVFDTHWQPSTLALP